MSLMHVFILLDSSVRPDPMQSEMSYTSAESAASLLSENELIEGNTSVRHPIPSLYMYRMQSSYCNTRRGPYQKGVGLAPNE